MSLPSKYPSITRPALPPTPVAPRRPEVISSPAPSKSPFIARSIPKYMPARPAITGNFFRIDLPIAFAPSLVAPFAPILATSSVLPNIFLAMVFLAAAL